MRSEEGGAGLRIRGKEAGRETERRGWKSGTSVERGRGGRERQGRWDFG